MSRLKVLARTAEMSGQDIYLLRFRGTSPTVEIISTLL